MIVLIVMLKAGTVSEQQSVKVIGIAILRNTWMCYQCQLGDYLAGIRIISLYTGLTNTTY